jgi:hypothetical protein
MNEVDYTIRTSGGYVSDKSRRERQRGSFRRKSASELSKWLMNHKHITTISVEPRACLLAMTEIGGGPLTLSFYGILIDIFRAYRSLKARQALRWFWGKKIYVIIFIFYLLLVN